MNSVLTNDTFDPIYNECSFDKQYSCSYLQWMQFWQTIQLFLFTMNAVFDKQYSCSYLQWMQFWQTIQLFLFIMNAVLTSDTVVPIYNEFSFDKQYSCSYLQWIQFWQAIQLFLFTMNAVLTNNTVVPIYSEFSFDKQYSCSYLQWIWLSRAIYLVHLKQVTSWSHLQRVWQITINTLGPTTWTNTLQQARLWMPFTSLVIASNTVGPAYNEFVRLLRTTLHYLRRVRLWAIQCYMLTTSLLITSNDRVLLRTS